MALDSFDFNDFAQTALGVASSVAQTVSNRRNPTNSLKYEMAYDVWQQQQAQEDYYFRRARSREDYEWALQKSHEEQDYQWTKYGSPEARRKALEDAGYSADLLAENPGSDSGGNLGMPQSSYDVPQGNFSAPVQDIGSVFERLSSAFAQVSQLEDLQQEREFKRSLRQQQLESGELDLARRRLDYADALEELGFKPTRRLRETLRFNEEANNWKRSAERFNWDAEDRTYTTRMNELTRLLTENDLNESNWRRKYIKRYNRLPEKGYSFSDFLADLLLGDGSPLADAGTSAGRQRAFDRGKNLLDKASFKTRQVFSNTGLGRFYQSTVHNGLGPAIRARFSR